MDMERIWDEIREDTENYVNNGSPDEALVFDAFPGSGKTTNVIKMLMDMGHMKFIYLAPNHDVIEQNITWHGLDDYIGRFVHFKGRKHLCMDTEKRRKSIEHGMPIRPYCIKCPNKDGCEYYRRKNDIEWDDPMNWAGVHAHIPTYLENYLIGDKDNLRYKEFDVLVIEENPISSLMQTTTVDRNDLVTISNEMEYFRREKEEEGDSKHDDQVGDMTELIDTMIIWLGSHNRNMYSDILESVRKLEKYNWFEFIDEWDKYIVFRINQMEGPMLQPPKDIFGILSDMSKVITERTVQRNFVRFNGDEPVIRINHFYGDVLKNIDMKMIGLDGTANMDIWENIFHRPVTRVKKSYAFSNVYQSNQGKYPQSSWIRNGLLTSSGRGLLKIVGEIVKRMPKQILLVGTKKIKPYVDDYLEKLNLKRYVEYAWYYNLRSKSYTHCDTTVLLCRPSPSPSQIDTYTVLSGWDEEVWVNFFTKDEMLQAIARCRPNMSVVKGGFPAAERVRDEPVRIFILSSENIFEPGMVKEGPLEEGGYWTCNNKTMLAGLRSGNYNRITDGEYNMMKSLKAIIKNNPLHMTELTRRFRNKEMLRYVLTRMARHGEVSMEGGKYVIP